MPPRGRLPAAKIARALGRLPRQGFSIAAEGTWAFLNNLPGFAQSVEPGKVPWGYATFHNQPLYKFWEAAPPVSVVIEGAGTINTRQTGQVAGPPGSGTDTITWTVPIYFNTWKWRWVSVLNTWRKDELATYGPTVAPGAARVRPTPVYSPGPVPSVLPFPKPVLWPVVPLLPILSNPMVSQVGQGTGVRPFPRTTPGRRLMPWAPRRPPPKGTKERKLGTSRGTMIALHLLSLLTEGADLVEAFYDALPDHLKGKNLRPDQKALLVYRHFNEVDLDTAIFNALWDNLIADRVWGKLGISTKEQGRMYGQNMGLNKLLSEAFGDQVGDFLSSGKQVTAEALGRMLGLKIGS